VDAEASGTFVQFDGTRQAADITQVNGTLHSLLLAGRSYEVVAVEVPGGYEILIGNHVFEVGIDEPGGRGTGEKRSRPTSSAGDQVRSPMTGVVIDVTVEAGAMVAAGQVVAVVESMKMNNELRSPRDGQVKEVLVGRGDRVERNAVLVTLA
jgi:acetyl/propionyl-CoA carboxylase alpha subunit